MHLQVPGLRDARDQSASIAFGTCFVDCNSARDVCVTGANVVGLFGRKSGSERIGYRGRAIVGIRECRRLVLVGASLFLVFYVEIVPSKKSD